MELEKAMVRELEAAGLHGDQVRDALRGILLCVTGFLVIGLRKPHAVPSEMRSETLWSAVDDPDIDPSTIAALSGGVDLPALFETTVRTVVDAFVPE